MVDFGLYCLFLLGSTPNFLEMYCDFPVIRLVYFVQAARLCAVRSKGLIKNLKKIPFIDQALFDYSVNKSLISLTRSIGVSLNVQVKCV